jgi:hypothetical protein
MRSYHQLYAEQRGPRATSARRSQRGADRALDRTFPGWLGHPQVAAVDAMRRATRSRAGSGSLRTGMVSSFGATCPSAPRTGTRSSSALRGTSSGRCRAGRVRALDRNDDVRSLALAPCRQGRPYLARARPRGCSPPFCPEPPYEQAARPRARTLQAHRRPGQLGKARGLRTTTERKKAKHDGTQQKQKRQNRRRPARTAWVCRCRLR